MSIVIVGKGLHPFSTFFFISMENQSMLVEALIDKTKKLRCTGKAVKLKVGVAIRVRVLGSCRVKS